MNDIFRQLQNMNPRELQQLAKKAQSFVQTPDGQKVLEKLKRGEAIENLPITNEQQNKMLHELTSDPNLAKKLAQLFGAH